MTDDELSNLWIGAFRYYMGRMTIAVHSFGESLIKHKEDIPKCAMAVIRRDLKEAIDNDGYLGMEMDARLWRKVSNELSLTKKV